MKTPDTVTLIYSDDTVERFNPATGEYEQSGEVIERTAPCLWTFMQRGKQFELYGTRENKVGIVRFSQAQEAFKKLKYQDETYVPIEELDVMIKGAVHVKRVVE